MFNISNNDLSLLSTAMLESEKNTFSAGFLAKKLYELNTHKFKEMKGNDIDIQKQILKKFTFELANKMKKFSIYRKKRFGENNFVYYIMKHRKTI